MMALHINGLVTVMTRGTTQLLRPGPAGLNTGPDAGFPRQIRRSTRQRANGKRAQKVAAVPAQSYVVDDIVVDTARQGVTRQGTEIRLGRLTFEFLVLLIEGSPGIVTQAKVADCLWNQRHVSLETVRQRVKLLRRALGDDPANPRYVRVIRGQGYRLIPAVRIAVPPNNGPVPAKRQLWIAAVCILALVALTTATTTRIPDQSAVMGASDTAIMSIAVLPFVNISGDSSDTEFLNGLHHDLLTRLAKQQSLDVNSRASVLVYRDAGTGSRAIGRNLNVRTILEGSIQRSGDIVRINVQLIDAHTEKHIWAETYDRQLHPENLIALQNDVAAAIAAALNRRLTIAGGNHETSMSKI